LLNAAAISGEYLSAASFMGIAGMVMKFGVDVLWYPVGYATGYLFLLLFIAAPLRRFGAYTVPDFAEGRFNSSGFRKIAVIFVMLIGFFYMLPQMKGAGVTLQAVLHVPYFVGVILVGLVVTISVCLGGMKGITFVQSFQFWLKLFAISVPAFILLYLFGNYGAHLEFNSAATAPQPVFSQNTTISYAATSTLQFNASTVFNTQEGGRLRVGSQEVRLSPNQKLSVTSGEITILDSQSLSFAAGQPIPNAPTNDLWAHAFGPLTGDRNTNPSLSLLYTYSLILAIIFGAAGLPHILVRFYTNKDGRAARHTTLLVLGLIGLFYIFPPIFGVLGRDQTPLLYASGTTDTVVLTLPGAVPGLGGQILGAITAAGAFAAFMSTFSGLLISVAGALAHDIYGKLLRPRANNRQRRWAFRLASLLGGLAAIGAGLWIDRFDINMLVGWAFAISASSFFPLLVLGTWWRGLTKLGATTGVVVGGALASLAIVTTMLLGDTKAAFGSGGIVSGVDPLVATLLAQPAIWSVPLSFLTMLTVSWFSRDHIPTDVNQMMLRLHVPEALGLRNDYIKD
jgi:Na+(H+)/acetate symporter ActP